MDNDVIGIVPQLQGSIGGRGHSVTMATVNMDDILKDVRFSHLAKDPRFRKMQKHHRKVKIDKRFQSMFNDQKFKMKYTVDKRGRPVNTSTNENLKKYYELSSDESEDTDEGSPIKVTKSEENKKLTEQQRNKAALKGAPTAMSKKHTKVGKEKGNDDCNISSSATQSSIYQTDVTENTDVKKGVNKSCPQNVSSGSEDTRSSDSESDIESEVCDFDKDRKQQSDDTKSEEDEEDSGSEAMVTGPDYARGEGMLESSSDEESQDEIMEGEEDDKGVEHDWGELDKKTALTEDITSRLAVCNMDWDRIKAHDILVLLNSFKPSGGTIKSVHIYPSEFGMKRMAEEDMKGPTEIIVQKDVHTTNSEDSDFQREKLREYQLKRLKYYYAVVECDSAETANHIYDQCDGLEYESTSNRLDLRFIPDDMEFDQEPKSVATDIPDVALYKPKTYVTSALQQSKVQCTWDETDHDRLAVTMRKFNKEELEDMDLKDYIASDSDEEPAYQDLRAGVGESESEDDQVDKYRRLIQELNEKEKKENQDIDMEITWEPGLKENTEKLVKKKAKEDATPWENYLEKKKEKKKMKRQKKKQADLGPPGSTLENSDSDVPTDVDLNDPYFKEELEKMDQTDEKQKKQARKKDKKKKNTKKLSPEELREREQREAELKLMLMDEDDQRQHFNLKQLMSEDTNQMSKSKRKKLKKKKQKDQDEPQYADNFEIDVDDPRFKELFENPHYNIDPSAPEFRKTKAVDLLIDAKQNRAKRKLAGKPEHSWDTERQSKTQRLKHIMETSEATQARHRKSVSSSPHDTEEKSSSKEELARLIKSVKTKTEKLEKKRKKTL